ncbi:MAG TPA: hypothetical protein PK174_04555 [Anaerolineaceae bacterium]|nr:hypothetical protein [Anaerolineaceae bacterium]
MEAKKTYEAPVVKRVRLDIKSSVMGYCQQSPDFIIAPVCDIPSGGCVTLPVGG